MLNRAFLLLKAYIRQIMHNEMTVLKARKVFIFDLLINRKQKQRAKAYITKIQSEIYEREEKLEDERVSQAKERERQNKLHQIINQLDNF